MNQILNLLDEAEALANTLLNRGNIIKRFCSNAKMVAGGTITQDVIMTNLEAIAQLEFSLAHNKDFKKLWLQYIEICILETLEPLDKQLPAALQVRISKKASTKIVKLFNKDWWEAQGLK